MRGEYRAHFYHEKVDPSVRSPPKEIVAQSPVSYLEC